VLVSIDTLRPDFLGAYGYGRPTSPTLDALAAGGVLFETAVSTAPWTLPGHGVGLPVEVATLAEILSAAGFETAAIVNSHNLSERHGLQRGFASFRYSVEFPSPTEPSVVEAWARQWIEAAPAEPFFLFVHYYDVHTDYTSLHEHEKDFVRPYAGVVDGSTRQLVLNRLGRFPLLPADGRHLADLYAAGIRQMDDGIARLLADLEKAGVLERSLLVVTSDHGEEFLEHGGILHGRTQYEEVLRVPLILSGPALPAGVRVAEPVSVIDVVPTALALLGQAVPAGLDGRNLAPLWRGDDAPELRDRVLFGEADHNREAHDVTRSVRRGRFKLLFDRLTGEAQLVDLHADPGELHDATPGHPQLAARLRAELDAFLEVEPLGEPIALEALTRDQVDQLEALGYLQRKREAAPSP
jgi:arylsulfatase A-like enzyme